MLVLSMFCLYQALNLFELTNIHQKLRNVLGHMSSALVLMLDAYNIDLKLPGKLSIGRIYAFWFST